VSSDDQNGTLGYRVGRLWNAADVRKVPLRTIIVAILAVAFYYLAGKLIYRLRDVLLIILVAGFVALILNPLVRVIEKYVVHRRGLAVTLVTLIGLAAFAGLAYEFGDPLVTGITNFANKLPSYITSAETGKGWIGKGWIGDLVRRYHVQQWVAKNAPKLVTFGQGLAKPALSFGEGALSLLFELFTIFVLVLLLLLEGPRLRRGLLSLFSDEQAREIQAVASQVNKSVVGYMLGNFTTSVICGVTVFISRGGGRVRGLHPDREPRAQPDHHVQDRAHIAAPGAAVGAGGRVDRRLGGRDLRRLRGGPAVHPCGGRAAGDRGRDLAADRPAAGAAEAWRRADQDGGVGRDDRARRWRRGHRQRSRAGPGTGTGTVTGARLSRPIRRALPAPVVQDVLHRPPLRP
jgi:hypothetical protein